MAQSAQVSNAKSGASQEVDAKREYLDVDKTALALGLFLDTRRKYYAKDDPFMRLEDYIEAMRDFRLISDARRCELVAVAQKRYHIEDGLPVSESMNQSRFNQILRDRGMGIYLSALKKSLQAKGINRITLKRYEKANKVYRSLPPKSKAPFIAEGMRLVLILFHDPDKLTPLERIFAWD